MPRLASFATVLPTIALFAPAFCQVPPTDGRQLYADNCARCHGVELEGGQAKSLVDRIWQFGQGRGYMIRNVKFGITDLGMPPFEDGLSNEQIEAVVDYVLAMEEAFGAPPPALPDTLWTQDYDIQVEVVAEGLQIPWAIDFLNEKTALITERPGQLRVLKDGKLMDPVEGIPAVVHQGQGGLMDVAVDPHYSENGWVYLAYSHLLSEDPVEGRRPPAMTRIVRGRIEQNTWRDEQLVYEAPQDTYLRTRHHYGCRIVFDPGGYLYFSIGDRGRKEQAQDLSRPNGKIHRVLTDGRVPEDNPFSHREDALASIYSYGHRNPQGLAVHPVTGQVWITEHGPMGGDELNLITPGRNYGWPVISYGRNYNGTILTLFTHRAGMAQPVLYWRPSIAVCGLSFYRGDLFPKWRNHLLAGALKYEEVRLLSIEDDRVLHQEIILKNAGRVRDVASGPDGAVYVVLNGPNVVLRLTPIVHF